MPARTIKETQVSTSSREPNRYAHVDALRALAVLIVAFSHAGLGRIVPGSTGVTIFFVISGFVITTVLLRERNKNGTFHIGRFYARRIFKIMPPYVLIIVIPTLVYSIFGVINWKLFLSQTFFVFNFAYMNGAKQGFLPGSGVVWSLAIEEQFYIVFALYWLFAVKRKNYQRYLVSLSAIICVGALVARFVALSQGATDIRIFYGTDTRADSIVIGIFAALMFAERDNGKVWLAWASRIVSSNWSLLAVVLLFSLTLMLRNTFYINTLRFTMESLAAAILILYGLIRSHGRARRVLGTIAELRLIQVIGLSSYSIYLVHFIIYNALDKQTENLPIILRVPVLVGTGVIAGTVIWAVLERPALRLRKRLVRD